MNRIRLASLALIPALAAAVLAGCGTQKAAGPAAAGTPSGAPIGSSHPAAPTDFPCPGEAPATASAPPPSTPTSPVPPTDHYAENHGFMVPFPLHGQRRCDGLAAVRRITAALEPLRKRKDFSPDRVREALLRLGYGPGKVTAEMNGGTAVSFLVTATAMCVEGTMYPSATESDAFGGYPDHIGCDRPTGGH
jgi:hypothetical protein